MIPHERMNYYLKRLHEEGCELWPFTWEDREPSEDQWERLMRELTLMPDLWKNSRRRKGGYIQIVFAAPITFHPSQEKLRGVPIGDGSNRTYDQLAGRGGPCPIIRMDLLDSGNTVSLLLHEVAHWFDLWYKWSLYDHVVATTAKYLNGQLPTTSEYVAELLARRATGRGRPFEADETKLVESFEQDMAS